MPQGKLYKSLTYHFIQLARHTYFTEFEFPFTFLGVDDYQVLLKKSGFSINRVELIPKDMTHDGQSGLEGWIRTTWLPYTQ